MLVVEPLALVAGRFARHDLEGVVGGFERRLGMRDEVGIDDVEGALALASRSRTGRDLVLEVGIPEVIEAVARTGRDAEGSEALRSLSTSTGASGTPWALGFEARSRALLSERKAAEQLYREAIERLMTRASGVSASHEPRAPCAPRHR